MFCCAVSKKAITHQQAVLLKPSGVVLLEDSYEKVVKKGKVRAEAARGIPAEESGWSLRSPGLVPELAHEVCPVTAKKLHDGDVIKLHMGGTSFAAHNEVEVPERCAQGSASTQGTPPRTCYPGG